MDTMDLRRTKVKEKRLFIMTKCFECLSVYVSRYPFSLYLKDKMMCE